MGRIDDIDLEMTAVLPTNKHIKQYLLGIIEKLNRPHDLARLREAITGLRFPTNISDPSS